MKCNKCNGSGDMGFTYSMRCNKCSGTGSIGSDVLVIKTIQMNAYNSDARVDITIKDEDPPSLKSGDRVMFSIESDIDDEASTYFIKSCGTIKQVWLLNCRGKYGEQYEVKDPVWIYSGIPGLALEVVVVANNSSG